MRRLVCAGGRARDAGGRLVNVRTLNLWLAAACAAALFAAVLIGSTPLSPLRVLQALAGRPEIPGDAVVIWTIRLPRATAALIVGLALGASGAALQGLLRNPLAEPGVLGVSSSASLAASVVLYWGLADLFPLALPLAAIVGAGAATALLAASAYRVGSTVTLILIGIGVQSLAGALMALLMNLAPNPFSLSDMVNWMLGSVANRSLADLLWGAPLIALGLGILLLHARSLAKLTLGEEAAAAMGVDLKGLRLAIIAGTGLAAGASVALAGAIGFVGIVAPHLVRPWVGQDPGKAILPASLLAGVILVLADIAVRIIPTQTELKLGIVAALVGAPAFIAIALSRKGAHG